MSRLQVSICGALILVLAETAAAQPPLFEGERLDPLVAGQPSGVYDLEEHGTVVGYSVDYYDGKICQRATRWQGGTSEGIGQQPEYCASWARAVNERGQILGTYKMGRKPDFPYTSYYRAFLWEDGVMTDLDFLGSLGSYAIDMNDHGEIAGWGWRPGEEGQAKRALYWDGSSATEIVPENTLDSWTTAINNHGQVVGYFYTDTALRAYLWQDGVLVYLDEELEGEVWRGYMRPYDINDLGQVAAEVRYPDGPGGYEHACIWEAGVITDLGTLDGPQSIPRGINNRGQVVGRSYLENWSAEHGFLWHDGEMYDLNDLMDEDIGTVIIEALSINDRGQIIVATRDAEYNNEAYLLTPITPMRRVERLIDSVLGLGLARGLENSYLVKLVHALEALESEDTATACELLQSFAGHTSAQAGKAIPESEAAEWIAGAQGIRAELGCP